MISWLNPKANITEHFTVHEACYLPSWQMLHDPTPEEQDNLLKICRLMEQVRALFGKSINVHCMIRPTDYNKKIGGAPHSAHILGLACDFDVDGVPCDNVRAMLLPKLAEWNCRMEDAPGSSWVHLDLMPTSNNRFFKP